MSILSILHRPAVDRSTMSVPLPTKGKAKGPTLAAGAMDPVLLGLVVALIAFGVVMVFSASAVFASQTYHDGHRFLIRQAMFAVVSIGVMLLVSRIDYHRLRPLTYPAVIATVALFIATMAVGRSAGGATRWIRIGPVDIQAAEVAKLAIILFLAYSLSKKAEQIKTFKIGVLPHLIVMALFALFCIIQPDLGSAVMIGLITFLMLFAAGARLGPILGTLLGLALAAGAAIALSPWRRARIEAFLDPFAHREGSGYQIVESMLAFGSGGLSGVGIGDSRQKLFFLPEAHTDFISAIIGEELGFVGMTILVGAFAILVTRGLRIAFRAPDEYGTYLAVGVTLLVGLSAFTNLAVAMGLLPTKGLVLPFISYGGSALLVDAVAIGVLLNVSRFCGTNELAEGASAPSRAVPGQSGEPDGSAKAGAPRANGARTSGKGVALRGAEGDLRAETGGTSS
jgi:cell division protein FtsW